MKCFQSNLNKKWYKQLAPMLWLNHIRVNGSEGQFLPANSFRSVTGKFQFRLSSIESDPAKNLRAVLNFCRGRCSQSKRGKVMENTYPVVTSLRIARHKRDSFPRLSFWSFRWRQPLSLWPDGETLWDSAVREAALGKGRGRLQTDRWYCYTASSHSCKPGESAPVQVICLMTSNVFE